MGVVDYLWSKLNSKDGPTVASNMISHALVATAEAWRTSTDLDLKVKLGIAVIVLDSLQHAEAKHKKAILECLQSNVDSQARRLSG